MNLLCFDVASGGISAAVFDSKLDSRSIAEVAWDDHANGGAPATLSTEHVAECLKNVIRKLDLSSAGSIDAICIGTFLHSTVLLDDAGQPLTRVSTWLDHRGEAGVDYVRKKLQDRFHELTGCRYHPMFPIFKIAALNINDPKLFARVRRAVSLKVLILNWLTGLWIEDHGMASASGLFNVTSADWEPELLAAAGLERTQLPAIMNRTEIVGNVTPSAAVHFGLSAGTPVVAGSGDGFLANLGSDCETPSKIAVSLGTSAVARQTLTRPVLNVSAGTFCYRADESAFILGCAGSNGGNVLDWSREILDTTTHAEVSENPPIFIPLLHGERSPDWDPHLTASWYGLTASHTAADLARSVLEGVIFNLAHFIEIVQKTSGERATDLVLSGNGFLHPMSASILATVAGLSTWILPEPGIASLRGAGVCALRALAQPTARLNVDQVLPLPDPKILQRYEKYRRLRIV